MALPPVISCVTCNTNRGNGKPGARIRTGHSPRALGGFATGNIGGARPESHIIDGAFTAARFYADVKGHPDEQAMKWAFEELDFFTTEWTLLGTYPASPFRG